MTNSQRKIGLLINPYAKKSIHQPDLVRQLIQQFPFPDQIWIPKDLPDLDRMTLDILEQKTDVLFIFGGDGTLRAVTHSLIHHQHVHKLPTFVWLQGGTANLFSIHYFGRHCPLRHLTQTLDGLKKNAAMITRSLNTLKINEYYGFIFAIGGFANFIQTYIRHRKPNMQHAFYLIFKSIISFCLGTEFFKKLFPVYCIDMQDGKNPRKTRAIRTLCCSTIPGCYLKPFVGIETDQFFSVLTVIGSPLRFLGHIPAIMMGKKFRSDHIQQTASSSIEILSPEPLPLMIDGDMLGAVNQIKITLGPQIKLLTV